MNAATSAHVSSRHLPIGSFPMAIGPEIETRNDGRWRL
jgi:hypothetical protein